jgi:ferritin-like metal-binding protein YciE
VTSTEGSRELYFSTQALSQLEETPGRQKCHAMSGLIKEGEKTAKEAETDEVRDALLIVAAQKVEHYEIASYGTAMAWCKTLGLDDVAELLAQTMKQEKGRQTGNAGPTRSAGGR